MLSSLATLRFCVRESQPRAALSMAQVTKQLPTAWLTPHPNGDDVRHACDVGPAFRQYAQGIVGQIEPMADLAFVPA